MKKFFENIKRNLKSLIIAFAISLVVGVVIFLIYYFTYGQTILGVIDGSGVAAAVLFGVGVLMWLAKEGAFDTLSYGFTQAFTSMFSKKANNYNDMVGYKTEKNKRRENSPDFFVSLFLASILFLVVFIVFEIYRNNIYKV